MSEAPDMRQVLDMVTVFDEAAGGDTSPDQYIKQILPALAGCFVDRLHVRFYRIDGGELTLWAADGPLPGEAAAGATSPLHQAALESRQPAQGEGVLVFPLTSGEATLGLLEVADATLGAETLDWLAPVMQHLAAMLDTLIVRDVLRKHSEASRQLRECGSFPEMAAVLARYTLKPNQFITIILHNLDVENDFTGFRTIAAANRHEAFEIGGADSVTVTLEEIGPLSGIYLDNAPVLISDVDAVPEFSADFRTWLHERHVQGLYAVPLRAGGHTFGVIAINSIRPGLVLKQAEMQMLGALTDQASALVQIHHLAEETAYTETISERQALAFNHLGVGQTFAEMAMIIARYMLPNPGRFLAISQFDYDSGGQITGWRTLASANRNQTFDTDRSFQVDWSQLPEGIREGLENGEARTVYNTAHTLGDAFSPQLMQFLETSRAQSMLAVPVMIDDRPTALLTVFDRAAGAFTNEEVNSFRALADQMSALIYVRDTLEEVDRERVLVENLVLASRLITSAETFDGMVQAVMSTIARDMAAVGLTLFDRLLEVDASPLTRRALAVTTPAGPLEIEAGFMTELPPVENLRVLQRGRPMLIEDIDGPKSPLSATTRTRLREVGVDRMLEFGLRAEGRLLGTLNVMYSHETQVTDEIMEAFTTVANQVGVAMRSSQLLDASREAESLASQLVETNRQISLADSDLAMISAMMGALPAFIDGVALLLFDRPVVAEEVPTEIALRVAAMRDGAFEPQIMDTPDPSDDQVKETLRALMSGQVFTIPDLSEYTALLTPGAIATLRERGIRAAASLGLRAGNRLLGILSFGSTHGMDLDGQTQANLRALTDQVAITIENHTLLSQTADALSFVHSQYETTNRIYEADDPLQMLEALYAFSGGSFEYAHLGLVDDTVEPPIVNIVAEISNAGGIASYRQAALSDYPGMKKMQTMKAMVIQDVDENEILASTERQRLLKRGIGAVVNLPLIASGRLVGVLHFTNPQPSQIPFNRLRALHNLADQLAVVFENRELLRQTEISLEETSALYEVNRALIGAQDELDVLRALHQRAAREAKAISLAVVLYNRDGEVEDIVIKHTIGEEGELLLATSYKELFGGEALAAYCKYLDETAHRMVVVEDVEAETDQNPSLEMARLEEYGSFVTIPIRDAGTLHNLITISYAQPRRFNNAQRRLFETIRGQIAVVFQNQRLLTSSQLVADRLGDQVRLLRTMNNLATTLSGVRSEQALLDETCTALVDALNIDHVDVALLDPDRRTLHVVSEYPLHGAVGTDIDSHTDDLQKQLQTTGQPVVIGDLRGSDITLSNREMLIDKLGTRSIALLPLYDYQGAYIGSVGLDIAREGAAFTSDMIETARTITTQVAIGLQNIRLLQRAQTSASSLQREVQVLETLNALSRNLNRFREEDELMTEVASALVDVLGIDHAGITLINPDGEMATVVGEYPDRGAKGVSFEAHGQVWDLLRQTGQSLVINDIDTNEMLEPQSRAALQGLDVQSVMFLPLLDIENMLAGSIGLDIFDKVRTFDDRTADIARTIVAQVAIGLQNIRLLHSTQRYARQMQRIAAFSQSVEATLDPSAIYAAAVATAVNMLEPDYMNVMLYDHMYRQLRTFVRYIDGETSVDMDEGPLVPLKTTASQVWDAREQLYITDIQHERDTHHAFYEDMRTTIVVPLFSRGTAVGVAEVSSRKAYAFNETDAAVFQQLVSQLAVALENAEAYTQSQRLAKNKTMANEISTLIQQQMDINGILNITMTELGKALGAQRGRIRLGTQQDEAQPGRSTTPEK